MIVNGWINYKIEGAGVIDPETGRPGEPSVDWSEDIPCNFQMNQSSSIGSTVGGTFTPAEYIVDIEKQELPEFDTLRIFALDGRRIGNQREEDKREFPIVGQPLILDVVDRIRFTM